MNIIKEYKVIDSGKNFSDITSHINTLNYQGYSADFNFAGNEKIVSSTLFDYKLLLQKLKKIKKVRFITHYDYLHNNTNNSNEILIAVRHDIDSDIIAAYQQAEIENELGIKSSWYVLHTAPYYGYFKENIFYRHNSNAYYYKKIFDLGHEVGLHTDPLLIYQNYNIDGGRAVEIEIEWLRSLGIDIKGTLAHNSKSVYGAVNYEVFKGRNESESVEFEGKWAPLGVLDEKKLKLEYEGNELLWQKNRIAEYGAIRNQNEWRWVAHEKKVKSASLKIQYKFTNQEQVISDIEKCKVGTLVTLVVHPLYYGGRNIMDKSPAMPFNLEKNGLNEKLGWVTYNRLTFQSVTNFKEYHALNKTNEWGMIDLLVEDQDYSNHIRILVLGADNTHAKQVGVKRHFTSYFSDLANSLGLKRQVKIFKLAGDGMGIDRLFSWYKKMVKEINPHLILLGMPEDIIQNNIPLLWTKKEGCSLEHPPGEYVYYEQEQNDFSQKKSSKEWGIRQKKKNKYDVFPNTNTKVKDVIDSDIMYKGLLIREYIKKLYQHTLMQIKKDNVPIVLFQEDQFINSVKGGLKLTKEICRENGCEFVSIENKGLNVNFNDNKTLNLSGHAVLAETLLLYLKEILSELD